MNELAEAYLCPDNHGKLSPFFSTIRWYLGQAAEDVLRQSEYND